MTTAQIRQAYGAQVAGIIALATILGAWGFQLIGGYVPCPLCLQQRWPYYIGIPIIALAWWFATSGKPGARLLLTLFALVMLVGAGLGVYHSGVEWHWWPGPTACASGAGLSGGLPDLTKARVISCDQAQWRFLGLSFAGWNVVVSLLVAALALRAARARD